MAKLGIVTGTVPDDGTGDTLLGGAIKINSNFNEVYTFLGDGTNLNVGVWNKTSVGINTLLSVGIGTTNPISTLTVSGNARISGATTVGSVSIANTEVISGAFQLKNIASLDATTTATIESAIALAPNTFNDIRVTGLSSFVGLSTFGNGIQVISGVSTLGVTTVTNLTSQQLNISGISTFAGITTVSGGTLFAQQLSVSGVITATSFVGDGSNVTGISTLNIVDYGVGLGGGGSSQWVSTVAGIHTTSNVGIGSTNPTSKLTVGGDASISGSLGVDGILYKKQTPIYFDENNLGVVQIVGSGNNLKFYNPVFGPGGDWIFDTYSYGEVVRITNSGNVGIGTTNPTSKLTVEGDISNNYTTYGSETSSASTLSPVGIHSALPVATYRSVEYFIQATTGSRYQAVKLLSIHDGSTAYNTTYGDIFSNGSIATFNIDISGGNVRLVATASTTAQVSYIVNYTANRI